MSTDSSKTPAPAGTPAHQEREQDGIYQNDRRVARVIDAEVASHAKQSHFDEVSDSEMLLLPDECDYREYRILVKGVEYASKVNKEEPHKGRILRGVTAEILGYREQ